MKSKIKMVLMKEGKGNLPYVVVWIGLLGLPSILHCATFKEAFEQYKHLKGLGINPSLLRGMEAV